MQSSSLPLFNWEIGQNMLQRLLYTLSMHFAIASATGSYITPRLLLFDVIRLKKFTAAHKELKSLCNSMH